MEGWEEVKALKAPRKRADNSGITKAVDEFVESGLTAVRRDYGDDVCHAYAAIYQHARRHELPVRVSKRGTYIYLSLEERDG